MYKNFALGSKIARKSSAWFGLARNLKKFQFYCLARLEANFLPLAQRYCTQAVVACNFKNICNLLKKLMLDS